MGINFVMMDRGGESVLISTKQSRDQSREGGQYMHHRDRAVLVQDYCSGEYMDHKDTAVLVQEYSREEYLHHGDTAFLIL